MSHDAVTFDDFALKIGYLVMENDLLRRELARRETEDSEKDQDERNQEA